MQCLFSGTTKPTWHSNAHQQLNNRQLMTSSIAQTLLPTTDSSFCLQALSAYTTVEAALNQIWDLSDSDSDGGDDLVNAGSQQQQRQSKAAHYEPPMAASQSEDLLATANHGQAGRGSRPAPKPPAQVAPASALLPHSASFNRDLGAQRQLSQDQGSLDRQGSGGSGSSLRASSMAGLGAAGPSRLGAPMQGRASGLSQQVSRITMM